MCVVDAEQVFAIPEMMELKIRQMAFADMIILNKVDLVDRAQVDRIKEWLDSRFHRYRLVEASHGDVPLEILLSVGRFDPEPDGTRTPRARGTQCASTRTFVTNTTRMTTRRPSARGVTRAISRSRWTRSEER